VSKTCDRAEVLAGAIALGEANETERDEYRRHISACESCLQSLGGEREIERVMDVVAQARESEVWAPAPVRATVRRPRYRLAFGVGGGLLAAALVASFGIHALVAASVRPITVVAQAPVERVNNAFHVTLEKRAASSKPAAPGHGSASLPVAAAPVVVPRAKPAVPSIVVVHNVITLKQNKPVQTTDVAQTTVASAAAQPAATSAPGPMLAGHAESIAVSPSYIIRDVIPIGGVTAINPKPAPIAYAQGAEGTTAFEVTVDERGVPTKCSITKTSGYLSLDSAVCKAAMSAHYSPRTINGRATAGIYRDAFTFRNSNGNTEPLIPN
jgi:TonB family protein